ncbi:hypothetical protein EAH84_00570 [Sphingomonas oligophenolica]|uniref:PAS domain-containing protein n=1 Tax=Sphingomonas oligophenolica TaxID=301154 RepID=A0A502CR68_9SPHN|nr:hypothetical protein EAH84_00570 [Sphingomonas oligophenolica]
MALHHSWPMIERDQRFAWGVVHDELPEAFVSADPAHANDVLGAIGTWECDLADNALRWSDAVYDIFDLPRRIALFRPDTLGLYREASRAAMERLRCHAIRHCRGFTLDAEIGTASGARRWMRLIAVPTAIEGKVVRLHGLKQDVTGLYC